MKEVEKKSTTCNKEFSIYSNGIKIPLENNETTSHDGYCVSVVGTVQDLPHFMGMPNGDAFPCLILKKNEDGNSCVNFKEIQKTNPEEYQEQFGKLLQNELDMSFDFICCCEGDDCNQDNMFPIKDAIPEYKTDENPMRISCQEMGYFNTLLWIPLGTENVLFAKISAKNLCTAQPLWSLSIKFLRNQSTGMFSTY